MNARIINDIVEFTNDDGHLCATYHYNDGPKSFFRGLFTPRGRDVVAFPPPDHPHHRGLQYALCTKDVNFWEEKPGPPPLPALVGRQHNQSIERFQRGDEAGFSQVLIWCDDVKKDTFHETRTVSVQKTPSAYVWTWETRLTALREGVVLIKGPWAARIFDGSVAYYGLGLRLNSAFFTEESQVFVNGKLTSVDEALGQVGQPVALQGAGVQVMFEPSRDPLYINLQDFVFMSLSPIPTTVDERPVPKGETIDERYVITVSDTT